MRKCRRMWWRRKRGWNRMGTKKDVLILCVGCGGVFYHGLSMMPNFLWKRGGMDVVLVDPDVVEERNADRQWCTPGMLKVSVARRALIELGVSRRAITRYKTLFHEDHLEIRRRLFGREKVVMVGTPDNHVARMDMWSMAVSLAKRGTEVVCVTGGNDAESGYAYGAWMKGEEIRGNWWERHADIGVEAQAERDRLAHPEGCGNLERLPQSEGGNLLTAYCVWRTVEMVWDSDVGIEMRWDSVGGKGIIGIRKIKDRVKEEPEEVV